MAGLGQDLGVRFNLLGTLPTAVLATLVAALVASGAPGQAPDVGTLLDNLDQLSAADGFLIGVGLLVVGLIV